MFVKSLKYDGVKDSFMLEIRVEWSPKVRGVM